MPSRDGVLPRSRSATRRSTDAHLTDLLSVVSTLFNLASSVADPASEVSVVSKKFAGKAVLAKHRLVHGALEPVMRTSTTHDQERENPGAGLGVGQHPRAKHRDLSQATCIVGCVGIEYRFQRVLIRAPAGVEAALSATHKHRLAQPCVSL